MRFFPLLLCSALAGGLALSQTVQAGEIHPGYGAPAYHKGRYVPTAYNPYDGNRPWRAWKYPSTYPWAQPVVYNAGPGNYYPAHRARLKQARRDYRWTGYPPRHLYVVDYNGYAPQYGFYPHY